MLNLLVLFGILALPIAGLILTPASNALARSRTSIAMTCLLLWLLVFWSTTLTLAWPHVASLLQTLPI